MTMPGGALYDHRSVNPFLSPRSLRIVVIDSDRDAVRELMTSLGHEGHEMWGTYNGPQGLNAALAFEPHAVFLDLDLPGMSGHEVAGKVKSHYGARRPLLVGMSSVYTRGADALAAEACGIDHYVRKPCEVDKLLGLLAPMAGLAGR